MFLPVAFAMLVWFISNSYVELVQQTDWQNLHPKIAIAHTKSDTIKNLTPSITFDCRLSLSLSL